MKRDELAALGITEKETVDKIMEINGADIEKKKSEAVGISAERDQLKKQLADVQAELKGFENVDVQELQGKITQLQADLAAKDAQYQAQLAEQAFTATVTEQALAAKCKNAKAVLALLDMDALKGSQNQKEDIAGAIKALQESDGYLFEATAKPPAPKLNSTMPGQARDGLPGEKTTPLTLEEAVRNTLENDQ